MASDEKFMSCLYIHGVSAKAAWKRVNFNADNGAGLKNSTKYSKMVKSQHEKHLKIKIGQFECETTFPSVNEIFFIDSPFPHSELIQPTMKFIVSCFTIKCQFVFI